MTAQREQFRSGQRERERIADLLALIPASGDRALDAGAWDGHLAILLAARYQEVVALDLNPPDIHHPRIQPVQGDVTALPYPGDSFDLVLCTEVLEHVPPDRLPPAAAELTRVARRDVVIGVPYRQDLRLGRTTCAACGRRNPPWGHVNSFTTERVRDLFPNLRMTGSSLVGRQDNRTNALAASVTDLAGNPYGAYGHEQVCLSCGADLVRPEIGPSRLVLATLGLALRKPSVWLYGQQPGWLHVRFVKE